MILGTGGTGGDGAMSSQNPIDALLEAEQAAEAEIKQRSDATHKTINHALEGARVISERAHRRIANIHTHCTAAVKTTCDDMWRAHEVDTETVIGDRATPERLTRVADQVAEKLTGGSDA